MEHGINLIDIWKVKINKLNYLCNDLSIDTIGMK